MAVICGHVVSVVNQSKYPPILVLNTRTPLGTRRTECVVGEDTKLLKGLEQLTLDEIRPGDCDGEPCVAFRMAGNRKDRSHRVQLRPVSGEVQGL